jgi:hypothetical protein
MQLAAVNTFHKHVLELLSLRDITEAIIPLRACVLQERDAYLGHVSNTDTAIISGQKGCAERSRHAMLHRLDCGTRKVDE